MSTRHLLAICILPLGNEDVKPYDLPKLDKLFYHFNSQLNADGMKMSENTYMFLLDEWYVCSYLEAWI